MSACSEVRRQDRLLDDAGQERLLDEGEYGFLAMNTGAGGYGVPISFVRVRGNAAGMAAGMAGEAGMVAGSGECIYFHCAPVGRKIAALEKDARVSFCVVGATQVMPAEFSTAYESVIVAGKVVLHLPDAERRAALRLLVKKYCPAQIAEGEAYAEKLFSRTKILRLDIERRTGKKRAAGG